MRAVNLELPGTIAAIDAMMDRLAEGTANTTELMHVSGRGISTVRWLLRHLAAQKTIKKVCKVKHSQAGTAPAIWGLVTARYKEPENNKPGEVRRVVVAHDWPRDGIPSRPQGIFAALGL